MKLNPISWAALGASLVLFQGAQAAPIRVTIVTHQEWTGSPPNVVGPDGAIIRMGHAMANTGMPMIPGARKPGCHMRPPPGGKLSLGDTIRKAMGLPPIESGFRGHHGPMFVDPLHATTSGPDGKTAKTVTVIPHMHVKAYSIQPNSDVSFLRRVHSALLMLGKWEARAVAFVLGCGIGVLLRMVWVFLVLIFRGVREEPSNTADAEYTLVLAHVDEALPKYTDEAQDAALVYLDEKTEPATGA